VDPAQEARGFGQALAESRCPLVRLALAQFLPATEVLAGLGDSDGHDVYVTGFRGTVKAGWPRLTPAGLR
jgi:hypothetical protein